MSITEHHLRQHLRTAPVTGTIDLQQILANGHRQLRVRRRRRALTALTPLGLAALVAGLAITGTSGEHYELAGSGLTLAAGSVGPVQVSNDRVDLGGGLQAWREEAVLNVGYPSGAHATLDTTDPTARWGDMGYDVAVLDPEGEDDGRTAVVGTVRGTPDSVDVTIAGVTQKATIACFTQAQGWCSYAAVVPFAVQDYQTQPATVRIS